MTLLCYHPGWGGGVKAPGLVGVGAGGVVPGLMGVALPHQGASEPGWNGSQGPPLHPLPLIVHVWRGGPAREGATPYPQPPRCPSCSHAGPTPLSAPASASLGEGPSRPSTQWS